MGTNAGEVDVEKAPSTGISDLFHEPPQSATRQSNPQLRRLERWNARVEALAGFEARGLEQVPLNERQPPSTMGLVQMLLLWFSANITINNLAVALTGPLFFGLGFKDCTWCVVVGVFLGAITTAYMGTWGAESGNRTMVVMRFFMGYYPSKLCTLLNIILLVGWAIIDSIIGGQVLSAVSGEQMSIAVGVVIVTLVQSAIAIVGLKVFHIYERFAWLPQLLILFILIGTAGPHFNVSAPSTVSGQTLAADRLSFLTLCFYVPNSWAGAASDYYVYYPPETPKWKIFLLTLTGLSLSFWFVDLLGVGLACGALVIPAWSHAVNISSGALIVAGYGPLGGFGDFCAVVIALGVIANCVPSIYSGAIGCQIMGRWGEALPRWVWVVILTIIQLVCALAGRNQLFVIFQNFLALMSYWLMTMICIVAEGHLMMKLMPCLRPDWDMWADRTKLPIGWAALVAFLLGWVGAVLGMDEVWFVGPLAAAAGGADVGMWVGSLFTLVAFPPLRWLEIKKFGR